MKIYGLYVPPTLAEDVILDWASLGRGVMQCRMPVSRVPIFVGVVLSLLARYAAADDRVWKTGGAFRREIDTSVTASWRSVDLRSVLQQLGDEHEVAILLDRRVDPTSPLPVDFANIFLRDGLCDLAAQFRGGCSLPDNVIYLGPSESAGKLRTLIALRTAELANFEPPSGIPKVRQQQWLKQRSVDWEDLATPEEILAELQTGWKFEISNPTLVEHDLWAEAALPQVTGVEALSLILIQFDMTFRWREQGDAIELVPVPEVVRIERSHKPRGKSPKKVLAEWQAAWPEVEFRLAGDEILAVATVEEHEAISSGKVGRAVKPAETRLPLNRSQFTLKIKDVPLRDLMADLEKSGVKFDYDSQALADAGIDLDQFVELNVRNLSAEDFFHRVFDPVGLKFQIDGLTVTLTK